MADTAAAGQGREKYIVRYAPTKPECGKAFGSPPWNAAEELELTRFRPEGSGHKPRTSVKLLYDDTGLHGIFKVIEPLLRCVKTHYGDQVYK